MNARIILWASLGLAAVFAAFLLTVGAALGDVSEDTSGEQLAIIAHGGLLYDKWYKVVDKDAPKETHPSYLKSKGKRKGGGTWRCKECHGWDYLGKDGAYASGSHFSGIPGIRSAAGGSPEAVVTSLKGPAHNLGGLIPGADLQALAAFVVQGQVDMDRYIDRGSKRPRETPGVAPGCT